MHSSKYTGSESESNADSSINNNQQPKPTSSLIQPANVLGKRSAQLDDDLEELIYGSTEKRKRQEVAAGYYD